MNEHRLDYIRSAPELRKLARTMTLHVGDDRNVRPEEWDEIDRLCANRRAVGRFRYTGAAATSQMAAPCRFVGTEDDALSFFSMTPEVIVQKYHGKVRAYDTTGNSEFLIDAINYLCFLCVLGSRFTNWTLAERVVLCAREFFCPTREGAFFEADDQGR